ncbi:MAG: UbiX family flavin prenyltransferase [Woeseiaceae bacterium]|nr:UbiX family flavin prenyltransferase [Woeseiaceae bacterium]
MRKLIIAITGASGSIYGVRVLETLKAMDGVETHLVVSSAGYVTAASELELSRKDIDGLADHVYSDKNIGAAIASGSFATAAMLVAPCSMKTLASIANGMCNTLISRAADVILKERRPLLLLVRETPLHLGHIRNMAAVTEMGGIVAPPVPAFYTRPESIDDIVNHTVGRALAGVGIDTGLVREWQGLGKTDPLS